MHSSVLYSFRETVSSMWAGANLRKILNVCSCWLFSELQPNVEALKRTVHVSLRAPLSSHKTSPGMLAMPMLDLFSTMEGSSNQAFYLDGRSTMTAFFTSRTVARSYDGVGWHSCSCCSSDDCLSLWSFLGFMLAMFDFLDFHIFWL